VPARGIVFDLDETLYRERRFALSGFCAVSRHVESSTGISAARCFRSLVGSLRSGRRRTAFQDACRQFDLDPEVATDWLGVYRAHRPRLRMSAGARLLLETLRRSWRLAVLTNGLPAIQRAKVEALGVDRLVDVVVYAEEHGGRAGKPDPAAFEEALRRLAVPRKCALVVGDDYDRDVVGARAAGLRAVWLSRGRMASAASHGEASAVIGSLGELPDALDRLGWDEV
jgi:putative hydrolase of the HAD superfamily